MDENLRLTLLLDLYGPLLTDRQREALSLHLEEDLSYSEIAGEMGISRQGAADAAGAARAQLTLYEEKLGLLARHLRTQASLRKAMDIANRLEGAQELRAVLRVLMEEDEHGV